ncbi:MAG: MBL fold metallo-hydrolase [Gemmatimonadales bacterium]|nr:MBL fold metallo-hydrolase [Gemmatimonadota bacterium]MCL4213991.1 MBL fold metallo-hydrolase [Gemmatimonadales bacterium]
MFLKRFYDDGLAQASYMIGCAVTGEALVIDANRDVAPYLAAAAAEKLRITHVTETHIHADYVSGSRELARATGAQLYLSAEGGKDWQYAFAKEDGATLLRDGDVIKVGNIRIEAMHTPGHTPEHLSFLVTDTAGADAPMGIASGDFVFVGDVGRPDLLERAAKVAGTMEAGARQLFHSLERFRALPDFVQVWPGHGAGSACGKSLGAVPTSTVGYEKRFNWGVGTTKEQDFVTMVLEGQPDPPRYFAEMKRINREGPRVLGGFPTPARAGRSGLQHAIDAGVTVIDTRTADRFAEAHVPASINIPLNKSFSGWAGWLVRYDVDIHLVAEDEATMRRAVRELAMIGLDRVTGWSDARVVSEWGAAGLPLGTVGEADVSSLAPRLARGEVTVLDVRNASEWSAGHLPGAMHIPLGRLEERLAEIPRDKPLVVQCQTGGRSAIAASVLQRHGVANASNLRGGIVAWQEGGFDVVRSTDAVAVG